MNIKRTKMHRPVAPMNYVIWKDAYNWLMDNNEEVLWAVVDSVDQGYTPEEIYRHWLREAGHHRMELAIRCRSAAKYLVHEREASE